MKVKSVDVFLSIVLGLLAIYAAHSFLVVDACIDMGGAIDESTGYCLDENYHKHMVFTPVLLATYFFIGLVVSLVSVFTIKTIRDTNGG